MWSVFGAVRLFSFVYLIFIALRKFESKVLLSVAHCVIIGGGAAVDGWSVLYC